MKIVTSEINPLVNVNVVYVVLSACRCTWSFNFKW